MERHYSMQFTPDRRQPTPDQIEMAVDIKYIKQAVSKFDGFISTAQCDVQAQRIDRIERNLGWSIKTVLGAVAVYIVKILASR